MLRICRVLAVAALLFVTAFCPVLADGPVNAIARTKSIVVRKDSSQPGGLAFNRVEATPAELQKIASGGDVVMVLPDKTVKVPPVPGPHMDWERLFRSPIGSESINPAQPDTWLTKDVQGASAAWNAGYTGNGVKVAVIDEGIDICHPDLNGCQARVADPSSPYYGWPIVFDPYAMAYYALNRRPTGGYVDTSKTITDANPVYRGRRYTLPGTSKSGTYHIGVHPSYWLPYIINPWGLQPAVLVADESTPGVYDTVYVDINKDLNFLNDKPCRKGDETSWWDKDGDGLADYSAGMVYFIADGINPIPASDWLYHLTSPANGALVAFAGGFGKWDEHGTLVASAIAAKGKAGKTYEIPQKPSGSGMVFGMSPGAKIIQIGNAYDTYSSMYDAVRFAVLGYDGKPGTSDDADIVNMSFDFSSEDADGWDFFSRYITSLNETIAPKTTFVAAIGNGGPGYGTVSSPGGASSVITVGAATLQGSTDAFNPIGSAEQILFGDIQQWSDRGPSSLGQVKPDVAAIGAWATGDTPLGGSGENAWGVWGGTSLSAPITSGLLALTYEAYKQSHGTFPGYEESKTILMSSARDLSYNVCEQGAGLADAARAVKIASGSGGFTVSPPSYAAGDAKPDAESFPRAMKPGEAKMKEFTAENTGSSALEIAASGRRLLLTGEKEFEFTTHNECEYFELVQSKPDYLIDISDLVPEDADLVRIRVSQPYRQFSLTDPASRELLPSNSWMVSLLDWTDLNGDGILWQDSDGNGAVNTGEMQESEANPFMFANPWSDVIEVSARRPMSRIHDGLILGLHHDARSNFIPSTEFKVELEFYKQVPWNWLSVSSRPVVVKPGQAATVPVKIQVPNDAGAGTYVGSLQMSAKNGETVTVPVSVVVAAQSSMAPKKSSLVSGTDGIGDTFDNGRMFGAFDWGWRAESGDWRFYFMDVPANRPKMSSFILANAQWSTTPADTDIMIYRPDRTDYFSSTMPNVFGPYGLTLSGSSRRTNSTAGMWPFETATGGTSEWVAGKSEPGLNLIQLQNVLSPGIRGSEPVKLNAGTVWIEPDTIELSPGQTSAEIRMSSSMLLPGLSSLSYGFAVPDVLLGQPVRQDPVDAPEYSKWKKDIDLTGTGMIEIDIDGPENADLDLYLLYDADNDGQFDWTYEVMAISASIGSKEHICYYLPCDGKYRIAVHGFRVPAPTTFSMKILTVKGSDIKTTCPAGEIRHARPETIRLSFPPAPPGSEGLVFMGPPEAPRSIMIPVKVLSP
ncbi:MAG: S8 family serine peptidase [Armatimonadota bacterium]